MFLLVSLIRKPLWPKESFKFVPGPTVMMLALAANGRVLDRRDAYGTGNLQLRRHPAFAVTLAVVLTLARLKCHCVAHCPDLCLVVRCSSLARGTRAGGGD